MFKALFSAGAAALGAFFGPQAQAAAHKIGNLLGIGAQPLDVSSFVSTPSFNPQKGDENPDADQQRDTQRQDLPNLGNQTIEIGSTKLKPRV